MGHCVQTEHPPFQVWGPDVILPPMGGISSSICHVIPADSRHWKYRICNDWILQTVELYNVHNIGLGGTTPHS